jgi:hypothetical protein
MGAQIHRSGKELSWKKLGALSWVWLKPEPIEEANVFFILGETYELNTSGR